MNANLDLSEVRALKVAIGKAGPKARAAGRAALQKVANDIKTDAKILAPVDTGNLRSSVTYETRALANTIVAEIGPTAEYAIYQELGTSTQPPQAFLGPASDRHIPLLEQAIAQIPEDFF